MSSAPFWRISVLVAAISSIAACGPSPERVADRVQQAGYEGVERVTWKDDWFDGSHVDVVLHPTATAEHARAVWCDLLPPNETSDQWTVAVMVEDEDLSFWLPPLECDDPTILPRLVSHLEWAEFDWDADEGSG